MGGGGGGGGNDKRSVNAELNLVPYIDLLSTLICFLLITAVWQQISALTTNGSNPSSSDSAAPPDPNKVDLGVSIFLDRIEATAGKNIQAIPNVGGQPNFDRLIQILSEWKKQWPTRNDVTLHSDSQAPYKHLIKAMDTLAEAEFTDVGVNTQ